MDGRRKARHNPARSYKDGRYDIIEGMGQIKIVRRKGDLREVGGNLKGQLRTQSSVKSGASAVGGYLLPTEPSDFFACHHFPCLSRISKSSPFANVISLGSSAEPVSVQVCQQIRPKDATRKRTSIEGLGSVNCAVRSWNRFRDTGVQGGIPSAGTNAGIPRTH